MISNVAVHTEAIHVIYLVVTSGPSLYFVDR